MRVLDLTSLLSLVASINESFLCLTIEIFFTGTLLVDARIKNPVDHSSKITSENDCLLLRINYIGLEVVSIKKS